MTQTKVVFVYMKSAPVRTKRHMALERTQYYLLVRQLRKLDKKYDILHSRELCIITHQIKLNPG